VSFLLSSRWKEQLLLVDLGKTVHIKKDFYKNLSHFVGKSQIHEYTKPLVKKAGIKSRFWVPLITNISNPQGQCHVHNHGDCLSAVQDPDSLPEQGILQGSTESTDSENPLGTVSIYILDYILYICIHLEEN